MSEDQSSGGAPSESSGDVSDKKSDTVAYSTYQKAVSEAKKAKERLATLEAEAEQSKQAALSEQGKYKELFEKTQKDLRSKEDEFKKKESFFIQNNLKNTVKSVAKELGAMDQALDDVYALARDEKVFSGVDVMEDYSVNAEQVKAVLGEFAKKKDYLFKKQANPPRDITLGGGSGGSGSGKKLSDLSLDELIRLGKAAQK